MQIVPAARTKSKSKKKPKGRHSRNRRPERPSDPVFLATRERRRKNGGIIEEQVAVNPNTRQTVKRHRAACECQIDAYHRDGDINDSEYRAGLEFRAAWLFKTHSVRTIDSTKLQS